MAESNRKVAFPSIKKHGLSVKKTKTSINRYTNKHSASPLHKNKLDLLNKKTKMYTWAIHTMVWLVLFLLPLWFSSGASFTFGKVLEHFWLPLLYSGIIFYINLFFLVPQFLFGPKTQLIPFLFINILMVLVLSGIHFELRQSIFYHEPPKIIDENGQPKPAPPIQLFIYKDIISLTIPIIFSIAVFATERLIKNEQEKKDAENKKLMAELRELKYRLQPHFFFNSMNNIYSMVDIAPEKAKETLHTLSKLMRYMLYETEHDKVALNQEIEFLKQYIELMRIRFNDNVHLTVNLSPVSPQIKVAPLIFISLIENAFKHGISASQESEIVIEMRVDQDLIQFTTRNTNFSKGSQDMSGSGIGLDNLRKRLRLVYPTNHNFDTMVLGNQFITMLSIEI